jgi:ferredoxin
MGVAMSLKLRVDSIACTGHGLCADLLPERVQLDEWGYPIIDADIPPALAAHARRAVRACPTLALKLNRVPHSGRNRQPRDRQPRDHQEHVRHDPHGQDKRGAAARASG